MHIRLRHSKEDPSKQELFLVKPNNHDTHHEAMQTLWDEEQMAKQEFGPINNTQTSLYIQKRFCTKKPSDFIIEFRDVGHKYTYSITNGVAQWFFEITPSRYRPRRPLSAVESYQHKFFAEDLISVDKDTVDNLAALFSGRSSPRWVCGEVGHGHYLVRVYLEPEIYRQDLDELDMKHTMHMVCDNAKFSDMFRGLCGNKLKDQFSLTQIYWDGDSSPIENIMLGTTYTYLAAVTGDMMVKDLGWSVDGDGAV